MNSMKKSKRYAHASNVGKRNGRIRSIITWESVKDDFKGKEGHTPRLTANW
jgi:hypothetical protein